MEVEGETLSWVEEVTKLEHFRETYVLLLLKISRCFDILLSGDTLIVSFSLFPLASKGRYLIPSMKEAGTVV